MSGFLESAFGAVCGLIEAGPVKIDNKLVEGVLGVGAVAIAGYAAYKVLNDKGAAENVATLTGTSTSNSEMGAQRDAWLAEAEANLAMMKIRADQADAEVREMERLFGPLPKK